MKNDQYTECFVAAVDILGFSQYVRSHKFEYVRDLLNDIKNFSDLLLKHPNHIFTKEMLDTVTVNIISDTIVIAVPTSTKTSLEILLLVINTVVFNIYREYRVPCRGGISVGNFYVDDNIAFGDAYIAAHEFESNLAVYPRIIFPRSVYDVYYNLSTQEEINALYNLMLIEEEDELFICDYIGFSIGRIAHDVVYGVISKDYAEAVFEDFRKEIEHELCTCTDKRIRDKYLYFKNYYNSRIDFYNSTYSLPYKCIKVFGQDADRN